MPPGRPPAPRWRPAWKQALALVADAPRVFVIGGAQLYAQALPLAHTLVLTEIDADLDGDVHLPGLGPRAIRGERQHGGRHRRRRALPFRHLPARATAGRRPQA